MFRIIRFHPMINKKTIRFLSYSSPKPPNNNNFNFGEVIVACIATLFIYEKIKSCNQ